MEFKDLGLSEPVLESLRQQGFTAPTSIQEKSIPPLLQGRDVIAKAQTGSGKTLAFGIPLIERVDANRVSIQAVVVCPTRELAQQVADDLSITGKPKGIKVALVVGGVHVRTQRMSIPGCQVVVGTPGRMVDLLEDRYLPVEWSEFFVLDEFDRLLDMGFLDDIRKIVNKLPKERQTALYSATTPSAVMNHAHGLLNNPVEVEIHTDVETVSTVEQRAIRTTSARKLAILERLLTDDAASGEGSTVVFCNTKRQVRQLDRELWAKDFSVASLSGDHDQSVRFKVMERFRNREIQVLVATDVAARGLDIDHIGHVINYDVPFEVEDYVHRIGRTARAGRDGTVTTLVGAEDHQSFSRIHRELEGKIEMLKENQAGSRKQRVSIPSDKLDKRTDTPVAEPHADKADAKSADAFGANIEAAPATEKRPEGNERADREATSDEAPARKKRRRRRRKSGERSGDEEPRNDGQRPARSADDEARGRDQDQPRRRNEESRGRRDEEPRKRDDDSRGRRDETPRKRDDDSRGRRDESPRKRDDDSRGRRDESPRKRDDDSRGRRDETPRKRDDDSRGRGDGRSRSRGGRGSRDGGGDSRGGSGEKRERGGAEGRGNRGGDSSGDKRDSGRSPNRGDDRRRDGGGSQRSRRGGRKTTTGEDEPSSMISGERDDVDHLDGGPPRRNGGDPRRARNRYKRWEEEQLNKPVGLIADNWDQVEEIDVIRDGDGASKAKDTGSRRGPDDSRSNGKSGDSDPKKTSSDEGGGRKRRRSRRSRGGRGRSGTRESGASSGDGGDRKD